MGIRNVSGGSALTAQFPLGNADRVWRQAERALPPVNSYSVNHDNVRNQEPVKINEDKEV